MAASRLPLLRVASLVGVATLLVSSQARGATTCATQDAIPVTPADREIYALAVDSVAYPEEPVIVLLDEGLLRVEEDGTLTRRFRMVRQILQESAAQAAAELSFGYDPSTEEFSLDWARVLDGDGNVVSLQPVHVQELDEPVSRRAPVYTERKRVRASLGDVSQGHVVDWRYTLRIVDPPLTDDFFLAWSVNGTGPVRRSRLTVSTPATVDPKILSENLPEPTVVHEGSHRTIRTWSYDDLQPYDAEPFAADSNAVQQSVLVSGPLEWDDIALWYEELTSDRYDLTDAVLGRMGVEFAGATTLMDSLRAAHRWVAQDIRYASISLGLGGYQPRSAGDVTETGIGDCKDKTTLFLSLARHMGVVGHPVLVSTRDRRVSLVNRSPFRDETPEPLPSPAAAGTSELPPLLLVAAAALLGLEWWSWRRRVTV